MCCFDGEFMMASKTVRVYTSDFSGKEIQSPDEVAEVRVLDHPGLRRPVKLDAYALEVQSLLDADDQFVTLELVLPGQDPRKVVVPHGAFTKLFTTDPDQALADAEPLDRSSADAGPRRGRAAAAPAKKPAKPSSMSREQRGAVRDWANNNGFQVGDRGRIKTEVLTAFEAAHTN
jgi:hypothetical protein